MKAERLLSLLSHRRAPRFCWHLAATWRFWRLHKTPPTAWLNSSALYFLRTFSQETAHGPRRILELGAGESTLLLAHRFPKALGITLETDPKWFKSVSEKLAAVYCQWHIKLATEPSEYLRLLDPKAHSFTHPWDFVLVDGKISDACCTRLLEFDYVTSTSIVLVDNADCLPGLIFYRSPLFVPIPLAGFSMRNPFCIVSMLFVGKDAKLHPNCEFPESLFSGANYNKIPYSEEFPTAR